MDVGTVVITFLIDMVSKVFVHRYLPDGITKPVINGSLCLKKTRNYGFSGNLLDEHSEAVKSISLAVIIFSFFYAVFELRNAPKHIRRAFSMMLGGGIANLADRYKNGYVTDFICFKKVRGIIFNLADVFILCGAGLMAIISISKYNKRLD